MFEVPIPPVKVSTHAVSLGGLQILFRAGSLQSVKARYNHLVFTQVKKQPRELQTETELSESETVSVEQLKELGIDTARLVDCLLELERKLYPTATPIKS